MIEKLTFNIGGSSFILRGAEISDAAFIIQLRTGEKASRYLSQTSADVAQQERWLLQYKERELRNEEFYFIACDDSGRQYGTSRLYHIDYDKKEFEIGSWVFMPGTDHSIAIAADIFTRKFGFDNLGMNGCRFEVRKNNFSVIRYHMGYAPTLLGEDDLNYYYSLSKELFERKANQLIKILGYEHK